MNASNRQNCLSRQQRHYYFSHGSSLLSGSSRNCLSEAFRFWVSSFSCGRTLSEHFIISSTLHVSSLGHARMFYISFLRLVSLCSDEVRSQKGIPPTCFSYGSPRKWTRSLYFYEIASLPSPNTNYRRSKNLTINYLNGNIEMKSSVTSGSKINIICKYATAWKWVTLRPHKAPPCTPNPR